MSTDVFTVCPDVRTPIRDVTTTTRRLRGVRVEYTSTNRSGFWEYTGPKGEARITVVTEYAAGEPFDYYILERNTGAGWVEVANSDYQHELHARAINFIS